MALDLWLTKILDEILEETVRDNERINGPLVSPADEMSRQNLPQVDDQEWWIRLLGEDETMTEPDAVAKRKPAKLATRKPPNGDKQRERIARIVERLPEGETKRVGGHMSLEVRKKRFGWFLVDHHGDGRVALNCKASADMHDILQGLMPQQFHVPKYAGSRGWVGIWLDVPKVDWAAVEMAVRGAYERVAPKKLLVELR